MRYGYNFSNQWAAEPFHYDMEKTLKLLSKVGMDCLEAQLAVVKVIDKNGNIDHEEKKRFCSLLKKYDIKIGSVHAPYPHFSPLYLDFSKGSMFKKSITTLKNSAKIANELGATNMVVHPTHSLGFYKDAIKHEKKITKTIINNLSILRDFMEKNKFDFTVGLETMEPSRKQRMIVGDKPKEMMEIIHSLDSKQFKITWDMCHTFRSLVAYNLKLKDFKEIAENTCHIHYSSYSTDYGQCHVPTNFGDNDTIHQMLKLLKNFNGIVINEISPSVLCCFDPKITMKNWLKLILKQSKEDFKKWTH